MIALHSEHEPQPIQVDRRKLAVPRFGASGCDQLSLFKKPKLRRREVRELGDEARKNLTDAEKARLR
jgi:hypothetical protein